MSLAARDLEALAVVADRSFAGAYVASLDLELQARRLTLRLYGALRRPGAETALATITFFGAGELALANLGRAFPESVGIAGFAVAYDDAADRGTATLTGVREWSLAWTFDGLAYEEHAATLASLVDEE